MLLKNWVDLPSDMQNDKVEKYHKYLLQKQFSLLAKRIFDFAMSIIALTIISPIFFIICIIIKADSRGPVFFRQERITRYGLKFKIIKFRTMVSNAAELGVQLTTKNDNRITKIGGFLRKFRLDELPQLINIITGDMSFVGPRPEVEKYVTYYTEEMKATLLLSAGVTSEASILFRNEDQILSKAMDIEKTYIEDILPLKMQYNLASIYHFGFFNELKTMVRTVLAVLSNKKDQEVQIEK